MRNLLAFFALVFLTLAGVGWYLDWYHISASPTTNGRKSVTLDIDTAKISADVSKAEQRIQQRLAEKANAAQSTSDKKALDIPSKPADVK